MAKTRKPQFAAIRRPTTTPVTVAFTGGVHAKGDSPGDQPDEDSGDRRVEVVVMAGCMA